MPRKTDRAWKSISGVYPGVWPTLPTAVWAPAMPEPTAPAHAPSEPAADIKPAASPVLKREGASSVDVTTSGNSSDISPTSPFVQKLYAMLEEESEGEGRAVWVESAECTRRGWPLDAFTVLDNARFQSEVLPKFYRHSNFTRSAPHPQNPRTNRSPGAPSRLSPTLTANRPRVFLSLCVACV